MPAFCGKACVPGMQPERETEERPVRSSDKHACQENPDRASATAAELDRRFRALAGELDQAGLDKAYREAVRLAHPDREKGGTRGQNETIGSPATGPQALSARPATRGSRSFGEQFTSRNSCK